QGGLLVRRGAFFGVGALAAVAIGADGDTLAGGGGLAFWFSGGNTTRGPPRALTSTGASSRGTIFFLPSPNDMRSGAFWVASDCAGTTLVGLLSALMIDGSPLRGEPMKLR